MQNPDKKPKLPRVSVIVPIYNVEKYLPKCLESLAQQTLRPEDFEIILINDASPDNSLEIARGFAEKHNNVKVLTNEENLGLGRTRNRGIKEGKGEYLFFLDSDDYLDPIALETLLMSAYDNGADIVTSGFLRLFENGDLERKRNDERFFVPSKLELMKRILSLDISPMGCNRLFRKNLFTNKDIWFAKGYHEDVLVTSKLFFHAKNVVNNPEFIYMWLLRDESITSNITKDHIDGFIDGILERNGYILEEAGAGYYRKVRAYLAQGLRRTVDQLAQRICKYDNTSKEKANLYMHLYNKILEIPEGKEQILSKRDSVEFGYEFFLCFDSGLSVRDATKKYEERVAEIIKEKKLKKVAKVKEKPTVKEAIKKTPDGKAGKRAILFRAIRKGRRVTREIVSYKGGVKSKFKYLFRRFNKFIRKDKKARSKSSQEITTSSPTLPKRCIKTEVLFFCDAGYHIRNAALVLRKLKKRGIEGGIFDMTTYLDKGKRKLSDNELRKYNDITFYDYDENLFSDIDKKGLQVGVFFNDWGPHNVHVRELRRYGVKTLGIDEGVNDFFKLSEGFCSKISPYRTCEYVSLPGEFETRFFKDRLDRVFVSGLPSIRELYKETIVEPRHPLAVININFSYGVLTYHRDSFLETALEGCRKANIDYIITQHPADTGVLDDYNVTQKSMYDIIRQGSIFISRFSGAIIESLAMGKPCVYHNPHDEKVFKFQEPMGAYSISKDSDSLSEAIKYELERSSKTPVREYSREFMEYHANIGDEKEPAERITDIIEQLLAKNK